MRAFPVGEMMGWGSRGLMQEYPRLRNNPLAMTQPAIAPRQELLDAFDVLLQASRFKEFGPNGQPVRVPPPA